MDTLPLVTPEQVGLSAARLDRVRTWMNGWVDSGKLAGMVTCVMRKGELAFAEVVGKWTGIPVSKLMEGEVGVASTPGQGSDFWFEFPVTTDATTGAAP